MAYYLAGDYYRNAGDFLGIGKAISKVVKVGASAAAGLFTGGPVSAVTSGIRALTSSSPSRSFAPMPGRGIMQQPSTGVQRYQQASIGGVGGQCAGGWHLNKGSYYTQYGFIEAGTKCVKNRRLNPGNAHALRRAVRRQEAFVGLARRALRGTNYKLVAKGYRQNWRKPARR